MAKNVKGKWEKYRNEVIELDDCRCVRCGKSRDEGAVLQVHHKYYEPGRDYWDYPLSACETLCSGCHAKEHGIISPDTGWGFLSDHDLGSCCGICDYCGSSLRRSFAIRHPNWGSMDVGADCCDLLTGTEQASRKMDEHRKRAGRRLRFIQSSRWSLQDDGARKIQFDSYCIIIRREQEGYRIQINFACGGKLYPTLEDAKGAAFDALENGRAREHLLKLAASRAAQRT
jgi:hypothetical protein